MSWDAVHLDIQQNNQVTSKFNDDGSIEQTCTQVWGAHNTTIGVTPVEAMTANDGTNAIPTLGAYYAIGGTNYWLVNNIIPRRDQKSPNHFWVQVQYLRKIAVKPADKSKWSAEISFSGEKYQQDAYVDMFGTAITNSAGDTFDPSVKETFYDEVLQLQYQTTTPPDLRSLRGHCNSDTVSVSLAGVSRSYSPRTLLLSDGDISTTLTLGDSNTSPTPVWTVKLNFLNRADGFTDTILDQGMHELKTPLGALHPNVCVGGVVANANTGTIEVFPGQVRARLDTYHEESASPVKLNGKGQRLDPGQDPVFLCYYVVPQAALSSLFTGF